MSTMTSSAHAFVWSWLPGATEPVVCGRVDAHDRELRFTYGRSYLARERAIALQPTDLALEAGSKRPPPGLEAHGVIRDAAPDSWGMRVILRRLAGVDANDTDDLPLLTYLLQSGSDRIGALDFQASGDEYVPRNTHGTLAEIVEAGDRLARGVAFSPEIDDVLTHGSAVGGARPKALIVDDTGSQARHLIAKFSVSTDAFPWEQAEAVGMEISRRCGVDTAPTELIASGGRDVLLVTRFDRPGDGTRRSVLSGLTLLDLHELAARHGSYVDLAELIRLRFDDPAATLRELFTRIVVNVLVGNTDDHPRNVAAFWDGSRLQLAPAFDVCPQPRSTGEAFQAMAFGPNGLRSARLESCIGAAAVYQLSASAAAEIVERCRSVVTDDFEQICEVVGATEATRDLLWQRAVANPSVLYAS
jgi:serine/threonine-protein kinase HipA